jgi:hypothetical protein
MRLFTRLAVAGFVVVLAVAGATAARADASGPTVVGQLYVNDNTAGINTVSGFDRHADGTLTPLPGSPFAVGGAGTGAGSARKARSS